MFTDNCLERRYRLLNHWVHLTSLIIILVFLKQKKSKLREGLKKIIFQENKEEKSSTQKHCWRDFVWMATAQDFTYEAKNYTYTMQLSVSQYL